MRIPPGLELDQLHPLAKGRGGACRTALLALAAARNIEHPSLAVGENEPHLGCPDDTSNRRLNEVRLLSSWRSHEFFPSRCVKKKILDIDGGANRRPHGFIRNEFPPMHHEAPGLTKISVPGRER